MGLLLAECGEDAGMAIVRKLGGLCIQQRLVERLGCIKGCLEYLGSDASFPWLYGGTGHAFIIGLDPGVDVSSPDSWDHQPQFDLGANLGYSVAGMFVVKEEAGDTFPERQREAWDFVRRNIDRGVPCFGFELKAFYGGYWVITGYDDVGYYYSGWEEGGPLPWQDLGELFIPVLDVRSVQLCPAAPDAQTVMEGLAFALRHAQNPPEWVDAQARSGPAAWAYWAEALEAGEAKRDHHTYNAQLWLECREMAVAFCREARERLPGCCDVAFDRAAAQYAAVCDGLRALVDLHPPRAEPDWGPGSTFSSTEAAALVRETGALDGKGLRCLEQIVSALSCCDAALARLRERT
jgi:hypothetical protein